MKKFDLLLKNIFTCNFRIRDIYIYNSLASTGEEEQESEHLFNFFLIRVLFFYCTHFPLLFIIYLIKQIKSKTKYLKQGTKCLTLLCMPRM